MSAETVDEIAINYLDECQSWQKVIRAQASAEDRDAAGEQAMRCLRNHTIYDRKVIVSGKVALFLPDGTSPLEEQLWPVVQFGQLKTKGWLGRLSYIRLREESFLAWSIYDPNVLGPATEEVIMPPEDITTDEAIPYHVPIEKTLSRALHYPVKLIEYVLPYAR